MKNAITILLLALAPFLSYSQCEIPGGDFEDIQDISEEIFESGEYDLCTGTTIIGSPSFFPAFRSLFLTLEVYFAGLEVECQQFWGLNQHPGANGTASALQIKPDTLLNLADAITVFPCDSVPTALKGSYLHVGSDLDSAIVVIGLNYDIFYDNYDGFGGIILAGGSDEFTEFEVPLSVSNYNAVVDSITVGMIVMSDSVSLAEGNESYYVFDELELVYDEEDPLSVFENELYNELSISPNPVVDIAKVSLPNHQIHNIKVYNESGALVLEQNNLPQFNTEIDVSRLPNGLYVVNITGENFVLTKKLVKL